MKEIKNTVGEETAAAVEEYMKTADYVGNDAPGVVKEAAHANTAQGCNHALMLGMEAETAETVKAIRQAVVNAQNAADSAMGKTSEAIVGLAGKVDTIDGKGLSANRLHE